MRQLCFILAQCSICAVISGCGANFGLQAAPSSPLPKGVWSGSASCPFRTTAPNGTQNTQLIELDVSFEINERGVPIIQGAEIAIGRTVSLQGINVTYTRIESTSMGLVIHSNIKGVSNGVDVDGSAIVEFKQAGDGQIEYAITQTLLDSQGYFANQTCTVLLS